MSLDEAFLSRVDKVSGECWIWTGARNRRGYGCVKRNGRWHLAHRFAYQAANGPIPEGLSVCHQCDEPSCVNPSHLWVGTHSDNMRDMHVKGRGPRLRPGNPRLTESDVLQIRADPRSNREVADDYGVTAKHVASIRRGARWPQAASQSGSLVIPPRPD